MNIIHSWSELLIDLPMVWDLGLRITLLLSLAWFIHFILVKSNPRWRVQLWRFTSVALIALSLATFFPKFSFYLDPEKTHSSEIISSNGNAGESWNPEKFGEISAEEPWDAIIKMDSNSDLQVKNPIILQAAIPNQSILSYLTIGWKFIFFLIWGLGVILLALRWLIAHICVYRLVTQSKIAPENYCFKLKNISNQLGFTKRVELRLSDDTDVPFVTGLFRPVLILPTNMMSQKYSNDLTAILAHELAHIKSHDLIWMSLLQWIAIPLWFHPLTWKIGKAHSMACEEVSDSIAADIVGDVTTYSGTLARVALEGIVLPPTAAALSMARSSELMSRLTRLKKGLSTMPLGRRSIILSILAGLLTLIPLASFEFAFAESDSENKKETEKIEVGTDKKRIINFPEEYSVGQLHTAFEKESKWWDLYSKAFDYRRDWNWKYFGLAKGKVTIPAGVKVKLTLDESGARDTSWAKKLNPDDLYEIMAFFDPSDKNSVKFGDDQIQNFEHLTGLKELSLFYIHVTDRGLRFLEPLKSLEKLTFSSSRLKGPGLESIGKISSLEVLNIGESNLPDKSLKHLSNLLLLEEFYLPKIKHPGTGFDSVMKLPKLKYIRGLDLAKEHLKHFRKCKSLKAIDFKSSRRLTNSSLKLLVHNPKIEYLNFAFTNISEAGLVHLKPLQSLKRLELESVNPQSKQPAFTDKGMTILSEFSDLEYLSLPQIGDVNKSMKSLSRLRNLKHLRVGGIIGVDPLRDEGLKHLVKLQDLENLSLSGADLTSKSGEYLAQLPNLKSLALISRGMGNEGIAKLNSLNKLEYLSLHDNSHIEKRTKNKGFTYSCISRLNNLSNLKQLNFKTNKTLSPNENALDFSKFPQLENISIGNLRDKDLASLQTSKKMNWLQIGTNKSSISNAGLAYLANLQSLDRLTIGGTGVTDEGLVHLANMKKLNSLGIKGNISSKGLPHFTKLKSLQNLFIHSYSKLNSDDIKQLRTSIPSLKNFYVNGNRAGLGMTTNSRIRSLKIGQNAPSFKLTTLDGKEVNSKNLKGKVTLLYFWSTTCLPCITSMPKTKKAYQELRKYKKFAMIGLSGDDNELRLQKYLKKQKLKWPQVRIGDNSKTAEAYGVTGYPSYILIGPKGDVLHVGGQGLDIALGKALSPSK